MNRGSPKNINQHMSAVNPFPFHDLPADLQGEILVHLRDYPVAREASRQFSELIPPTPKYQYHLGLTNDTPELVAVAAARKPILAVNIYRDAATQGSLSVLQWAHAAGYPWDSFACRVAAQYRHLEVLKWIHAEGYAWDSLMCTYAAQHGHLEVLQWAHTHGYPWNSSICMYAAENGHLEVLKWARANGCPWGPSTCAHAAMYGHLEILQWAIANGCPWDPQVCFRLSKDHPRVQEWILQNM